jgi:WD40 repeat protein
MVFDACLWVTGASDNVCRFFDTRNSQRLRTFKPSESLNTIAGCHFTSSVAADCHNDYITFFDFKQNEMLSKSHVHDGAVTALAFQKEHECSSLAVPITHDFGQISRNCECFTHRKRTRNLFVMLRGR